MSRSLGLHPLIFVATLTSEYVADSHKGNMSIALLSYSVFVNLPQTNVFAIQAHAASFRSPFSDHQDRERSGHHVINLAEHNHSNSGRHCAYF